MIRDLRNKRMEEAAARASGGIAFSPEYIKASPNAVFQYDPEAIQRSYDQGRGKPSATGPMRQYDLDAATGAAAGEAAYNAGQNVVPDYIARGMAARQGAAAGEAGYAAGVNAGDEQRRRMAAAMARANAGLSGMRAY